LVLYSLHYSMIVAVVAVHMVEVAADQIIGMIAVRNRLVAALRAVNVALFVLVAAMCGRALSRIGCIDADAALVNVIAMNVMKVAIVQIVAVVAVPNRPVSAAGLMNMLVRSMRFVVWHKGLLPQFNLVVFAPNADIVQGEFSAASAAMLR
jgi:hypothetical protein